MKFKTAILTAIMLTTTPALASSDMETAAGTSVLVLLFLDLARSLLHVNWYPV